jgi:carboxypeptidase C (cathepsin A)
MLVEEIQTDLPCLFESTNSHTVQRSVNNHDTVEIVVLQTKLNIHTNPKQSVQSSSVKKRTTRREEKEEMYFSSLKKVRYDSSSLFRCRTFNDQCLNPQTKLNKRSIINLESVYQRLNDFYIAKLK